MHKMELSKNDRIIIKCMVNKGPMRIIDIKKETGLAKSSVIQRLKALQTDIKGNWVKRTGKKYCLVDRYKQERLSWKEDVLDVLERVVEDVLGIIVVLKHVDIKSVKHRDIAGGITVEDLEDLDGFK